MVEGRETVVEVHYSTYDAVDAYVIKRKTNLCFLAFSCWGSSGSVTRSSPH